MNRIPNNIKILRFYSISATWRECNKSALDNFCESYWIEKYEMSEHIQYRFNKKKKKKRTRDMEVSKKKENQHNK